MLMLLSVMKLLLYLLKQLQTVFTCCCRREPALVGWSSMSGVMLRARVRAKELVGSTRLSLAALHSPCSAPFWQNLNREPAGIAETLSPYLRHSYLRTPCQLCSTHVRAHPLTHPSLWLLENEEWLGVDEGGGYSAELQGWVGARVQLPWASST